MKNHNQAFYISGGIPLEGEIHVHSAKNATLPLILASLLTDEAVMIEKAPKLSDVYALCSLLEHFGAKSEWQDDELLLHAESIHNHHAPYHLVSKLRASFVAMGALLGRCGEARISMPGGCAFGPRPVDRHIKAFRQLGVEISEDGGDFLARIHGPLKGHVVFEAPTVGGTQNIILASVLGEGNEVLIEHAALEPEIIDLADMLNAMGADISGAGTSQIHIKGVKRLKGIRYRPIADRIEAGTLMLMTAATRGRVWLRDVKIEHLSAIISKLRESGVIIQEDLASRSLNLDARGDLKAVSITAVEYPGLATDVQAPFGAYLATVEGVSVVTDKVYPDRFTHVDELSRAGAQMKLYERTLVIRGTKLHGAEMHASDIRAGGALVTAALAAQGNSLISGVEYIARGYEALPERLRALGAVISQESLDYQPNLATGTFGG
ncbi:MAG: UDP-N-acetylglucosamine 1-carboxyvinyltransferase [Deinococcales bacterium]